MFKIFNRNTEKKVVEKMSVAETNAIIDQIHYEFDTEVDRLLEQSKIKRPDIDIEDSRQKALDLINLGFTFSKTVSEVEAAIKKKREVADFNRKMDSLREAIEYFSGKYPLYKFITEDSVKKICSKYNLVYSTVGRYIGDIPDENLQHIKNFKIDEKDCHFSSNWRDRQPSMYIPNKVYTKSPLEIAAPLKDFRMRDSEIKDFKIVDKKIEIPDPVVMQPVTFKGGKYYLIVTAWGKESEDELVVNPKMN